MKKFIVILIVFLGLVRADGDMKKAVFDLTTSDLTTFESKVIKATSFIKAHYASKSEELDILVVIHGGAYKFFVKDLQKTKYKDDKEVAKVSKELREKIESLIKTYNVKFQICGVGMKKNKLTKDDIYDFVEVVTSATIGLIDAQSKGYVYLPIE